MLPLSPLRTLAGSQKKFIPTSRSSMILWNTPKHYLSHWVLPFRGGSLALGPDYYVGVWIVVWETSEQESQLTFF